MSTRPTGRKQRSIRLTTGSPEAIGEHFTFCITVDGRCEFYGGVELATDYGRGFRVHKETGEQPYDVNIDGRRSTCECVGFGFRGHCRHLAGLEALIRKGQLPPVRPAQSQSSARESGPDQDKEPEALPLSGRFPSLGRAMKHCPEAFYGHTEYPDDAA
jgi:hypothetical protein